ncbi:hypothetical protein AA471_11120 [Salmonella enterica subsp. enterica]|nr:hypothetical protein [Salmonella enterica subsp. enterica]EDQ2988615.1 hypothetical protein [Salmonella enterica subsp. enterica]
MEIIFGDIPLARSGYSDKRGELRDATLFKIHVNPRSEGVNLYYKKKLIGMVINLTFIDLHNGAAELRGDIVLGCNYNTIAKMAFDEVYPVISISCKPNGKGAADYRLKGVSLDCKEEREFEDQQPLDLSELRKLVNAIAKTKESDKGEDVHRGWTDPVRKPYVYAPNMSKEGIANWLSEIVANLRTIDTSRKGLKEMEVCHTKLEAEMKESEAFLAKAIRN